MLKPLLFLIFLCSSIVHAQDLSQDLNFIETQNTDSTPFNVPMYIDLNGSFNIISRNKDTDLSFAPNLLVAYNKTTSLYIKPIQRTAFSFDEQKAGLEWIQIKRKRWEFGLGITAMMNQMPFFVGFTPYKGARSVTIRQIKDAKQDTPTPKLPKTVEDIADWRAGDQGSYQTYGGVEVAVGVRYSIANIFTVGLTIQNLFSVVIHKTSEHKITVSIGEETLNKRRMQSGIGVATGTLNFFNGKRMTISFKLDLDSAEDRKLFVEAMKGNLSAVQGKLSQAAQKLEWKGSERIGYYGVPTVAGQTVMKAQYNMDFDGEKDTLGIKSKKNSGFLLPMRTHNKLVYQSETAIIMFWYSEMNKANDEVLGRKFLTPGKVIGAKGFDSMIPEGTVIGSTHSQMGMSFSREELENISSEVLEEVIVKFEDRCIEMKQDCANPKKFKKIVKKLRSFLGKKWEDIRDDIGFLMLEQPALIYGYLKTIKSKKFLYFKFLNEKYQSMEGAAPIEI